MKGTAKRWEKQARLGGNICQKEVWKSTLTKNMYKSYLRNQTDLMVVKSAGHSRILLKSQHLEEEVRGSRA